MRLVGVFACVLVALLLAPAAQAVVSTRAYANAARFDRLTGQKTQSGVQAVHRALDPLTTAA
jgi:hypothetical protein